MVCVVPALGVFHVLVGGPAKNLCDACHASCCHWLNLRSHTCWSIPGVLLHVLRILQSSCTRMLICELLQKDSAIAWGHANLAGAACAPSCPTESLRGKGFGRVHVILVQHSCVATDTRCGRSKWTWAAIACNRATGCSRDRSGWSVHVMWMCLQPGHRQSAIAQVVCITYVGHAHTVAPYVVYQVIATTRWVSAVPPYCCRSHCLCDNAERASIPVVLQPTPTDVYCMLPDNELTQVSWTEAEHLCNQCCLLVRGCIPATRSWRLFTFGSDMKATLAKVCPDQRDLPPLVWSKQGFWGH
jgi:hypothetical protein